MIGILQLCYDWRGSATISNSFVVVYTQNSQTKGGGVGSRGYLT